MQQEAPEQPLSRKKLKQLTRLSIAELKQLAYRPDVVELADVNARFPKLLVHLKSLSKTVPVPSHWSLRRKYLQNKRGIEKQPFVLPDFIQATGITEMRGAMLDKDAQTGLRAKMREKIRPKLNKINIDYQKMHNAFFKWQHKPENMTLPNDAYYEGKELDMLNRHCQPGCLSDAIKTALGIPLGTAGALLPPPWLIAMQRYGPPPSYPNLHIPGLNAPIPNGASFGYQPGGWGKPPVDELGRPLYGNVFAQNEKSPAISVDVSAGNLFTGERAVSYALWGEAAFEDVQEEEIEETEQVDNKEEKDLIETEHKAVDLQYDDTKVAASLKLESKASLYK